MTDVLSANPATLSDEAFTSLIANGGEIIAAGRPRTPFSALKKRDRTEMDLQALASLALPAQPTAAMRNAYAPVLAEIRRFDPGSVVCTALEPGQGTTFTAANLAMLWAEELARETSEKILLCEFFCGPRQADTLIDEQGDVFQDAGRLERFSGSTPQSNLFRLTVSAANAQLDGMAALWKRLTATFSRILCDVSPAGFNPLFPWLTAHASGTALVSRRAADGKQVKKLAEKIGEYGGRFMGVIINA